LRALGYCQATGIGSLPFVRLTECHELINKTFPLIPHWPQLPKLGESEGFINQYLTPLIKIGLIKAEPGRTPYFDTNRPDFTDLLTEFYSLYLEAGAGDRAALERFGFGPGVAQGFYSFIDQVKSGYYDQAKFLKGQVSGPTTLGLQVTDADRKASFYNDQLRDVLTKTLALSSRWQAKMLAELGLPVLIFIDDPGVYSLGLSTYITLTKEGITSELEQVVEAVESAGALVGSHTCAGTDWSLLFAMGLQVVNFDAYEYFSSISIYPGEINAFLEKGGILAFGIIPTSDKILSESEDRLADLFSRQVDILEQKGVNKERLLKQVMITPSCGTGSLSEEMAITVYQITNAVSKALRKKYHLD
jgi:methionine synthase II (cobalamin-independent)